MARRLLHAHDVELHSAELSRPGPTAISIRKLNFDIRQGRYRLNLQAENVTLSYRVADLLRGRLQGLESPHLNLTLHRLEHELKDSAVKPVSTPLASLLPESLFQQLPVGYIDIEHLGIRLPLPQDYSELEGDLRFTGEQLTLTLENSGLSPITLHVQADRDNHLSATLGVESSSLATIQSHVADSDKELRGELQVNLGAISKLLTNLALMPENQHLSGDLTADWAISLPQQIDHIFAKQARLRGNIQSAGGFSLVQQVDDQPLDLQGDYQLQAQWQATAQNLELVVNKAAVLAHTGLPGQIADLNPRFMEKPLSIEFQLEPGARFVGQSNWTILGIENLAGDLRASQAPAGFDALFHFHSVGLENKLDSAPINAASSSNPDAGSASAENSISGGKRSVSEVKSQGVFKLHGTLDRATSANYSADELRFESSGSMILEASELLLSSDSDTVFSAKNISDSESGRVLLPDLQVSALAPLSLSIKDGNLSIHSAQLAIAKQQIYLPDVQAGLSQGLVKLDKLFIDGQLSSSSSADLSLDIFDLEFGFGDKKLAPVKFNARLTLNNNRVEGNFTAQMGDQLLNSKGALQHNLDTGSGQLSANTQSMLFSESRVFLPRLIKPLRLALDLSAGQLSVETQLTWHDQGLASSRADFSLLDIGGFYQRNFIKGLNATLSVRGLHDQWSIPSSTVHMAEIDAGVLISNIQFKLKARPPVISTYDFQAELLGGIVSQKAMSYDWTQPKNKLVINLQDIELNQVLDLESDISGSGSLDGALPLEISSGGLRLVNGSIRSRAPGGFIRYDSEVPSGSSAINSGLQLTLNALKNFHYSLIAAQIDSDESGNIVLGATLQGRNPDLEDQRPLHFNLNISENLPALMKSLKLAQDISDDLDQRIESLYRASSKPDDRESRQ